MPPPFVADIKIKAAQRSPVLVFPQRNERNREVIAPQKAPDPPRYGDTPCRPSRQPMYSFIGMRDWRSVMNDAQSGVIPKTTFDNTVGQPYGKSLTWNERTNVVRESPQPYGSAFGLQPQTADEANLRIQMGI